MTVTQAVRNACGQGAIQIAGPWRHEGVTYHAAVVWREGATTACLAMVRAKKRGVVIVAHGQIAAGSSARYGESYAPALRAEPLLLGGVPPLVVTDTAAMGQGGGGGSVTEALRVERCFDGVVETLEPRFDGRRFR